MANSIRLKRRETTGTAITSSTLPTLAAGELAVDLAASDPVLYVGDDTGTVRQVAVGLTQAEADLRYRQLDDYQTQFDHNTAKYIINAWSSSSGGDDLVFTPRLDDFKYLAKGGQFTIRSDRPITEGIKSFQFALETNSTSDARLAYIDYTDATDLPNAHSIVTRTRGDARYLMLSGGTATGSIKLDDAQLEIKVPKPKAMLRLETSGNPADQKKVVLRMSPQGDLVWMLAADNGVAVQQYRMDRGEGQRLPETILRRYDADSRYQRLPIEIHQDDTSGSLLVKITTSATQANPIKVTVRHLSFGGVEVPIPPLILPAKTPAGQIASALANHINNRHDAANTVSIGALSQGAEITIADTNGAASDGTMVIEQEQEPAQVPTQDMDVTLHGPPANPVLGETVIATESGTIDAGWGALAGQDVGLNDKLVWDGYEWTRTPEKYLLTSGGQLKGSILFNGKGPGGRGNGIAFLDVTKPAGNDRADITQDTGKGELRVVYYDTTQNPWGTQTSYYFVRDPSSSNGGRDVMCREDVKSLAIINNIRTEQKIVGSGPNALPLRIETAWGNTPVAFQVEMNTTSGRGVNFEINKNDCTFTPMVGTATDSPADESVITRQRGDARYQAAAPSTIRVKEAIAPLAPPDAIWTLEPRAFRYRDDLPSPLAGDESFGLMAEDVAAAGFERAVIRDDDGHPARLREQALIGALWFEVGRLRTRLAELEEKA